MEREHLTGRHEVREIRRMAEEAIEGRSTVGHWSHPQKPSPPLNRNRVWGDTSRDEGPGTREKGLISRAWENETWK